MKKMARLLARAAARLLYAFQPPRKVLRLFQIRLRDLAGGYCCCDWQLNASEPNPQKQTPPS